MKSMTQPINLAVAACTIGSSLVAPFVWGSGIKSDISILNTKAAYTDQRFVEINNKLEIYDRKLDALLISNGINPDKLK